MTSEDGTALAEVRSCDWCRKPMPAGMRVDAITCSKRCRQARHRFVSGVGTPAASAEDRPLKLAYADPPYPGLSRRYYGSHPDYAGEVDHEQLIRDLVSTYDGWALSTSARALPAVLGLCPPGTLVAAWHCGERADAHSARPLNAWQPVIYWGGRVAVAPDASAPRRTDSLIYRSTPRTTDPNRVIGAKPAIFCRWVFDLLGAQPGDDFTDVFPGSGGVSRAWDVYNRGSALAASLNYEKGGR